jgi:hypothetical protein
MTLIDVLVELDDGTQTTMLANIVEERKDSYVVVYMVPTNKTWEDGRTIYRWEDDYYAIDKETVSGFYDSTNEEDADMVEVESGWIKNNAESDYEPSWSGSDTDTDTDESLVESEED